MSNNAYNIKFNGNDNHLKVKLEQNIDTLNFLSLKLSTKDAYNNFNSDHGILMGRVTANNGMVISNARVSVFIPLTDEDALDEEIYAIYPYKNPRDVNNSGKRYNLLPRVGKMVDEDLRTYKPLQPFGTFPTKEETLANEKYLEVYNKYYKYSTVTNQYGDYMIIGVPVGTQTVHMSVDITDIGNNSMTAASMVKNLGYSENFFTNNNTRIKSSKDLNDLPNIETQDITVDVIPFWGDKENFEIGITRQDFRVRANLGSTFVVFGASHTDGFEVSRGSNNYNNKIRAYELYVHGKNTSNIVNDRAVNNMRTGKITEKIFYFPNSITDEEIDAMVVDRYPYTKLSSVSEKLKVLDETEYSSYKKDDGTFVFIINCNRNKVSINENGEEYSVGDTEPGYYTEFRGFFTFEYTKDTVNLDWTDNLSDNDRGKVEPLRGRLKVPQNDVLINYSIPRNYSSDFTYKSGHLLAPNCDKYDGDVHELELKRQNNLWRWENFTFKRGKFYSVAQYHSVIRNDHDDTDMSSGVTIDGYVHVNQDDVINNDSSFSESYYNSYRNNGIIYGGYVNETDNNNLEVGTKYGPESLNYFPFNYDTTKTYMFGVSWLNLCLYFPQFGVLRSDFDSVGDGSQRVASHYLQDNAGSRTSIMANPNTIEIAAGIKDTSCFLRADMHDTNFIEVTPEVLRYLLETLTTNGNYNTPYNNNGVYEDMFKIPNFKFSPYKVSVYGINERSYVYKGFNGGNCIGYLNELGLI